MKIKPFIVVMLLLWAGVSAAQSDEPPPYLYYYSSLLGGLIIERADGTESRHIAADVIPAGMSGLGGPGWSPSGKYFAAYGFNLMDYGSSTGNPYLIDLQGVSVTPWFSLIATTAFMEWSPTGEDILLVIGSYHSGSQVGFGSFFWLIDAESGTVLADFGANFYLLGYDVSDIGWDAPNKRVAFYLAPDTYDAGRYYRVTMHFDGTILREPVDAKDFTMMYEDVSLEDSDNVYEGYAVSPSGNYVAQGSQVTILIDNRSKAEVALPQHTQGTTCRSYLWNDDEQYILTVTGTVRAGGSCSGAVLGVTDYQGKLWRELGGCGWGEPCAGWLPHRVDTSLLPVGQPEPIQLDPVNIEYENEIMYGIRDITSPNLLLRCSEPDTASIIDTETQETLYSLSDVICPYNSIDSFADVGLKIIAAYNSFQDVLVTYHGYSEDYVSVWMQCANQFTHVLKLNSQGYELEFTPDGRQLRTRNVNAWKIYDVADILETADFTCPL